MIYKSSIAIESLEHGLGELRDDDQFLYLARRLRLVKYGHGRYGIESPMNEDISSLLACYSIKYGGYNPNDITFLMMKINENSVIYREVLVDRDNDHYFSKINIWDKSYGRKDLEDFNVFLVQYASKVISTNLTAIFFLELQIQKRKDGVI